MLASRVKIHDFMTCYGEYSVHINVPIRVASAAALAAGVAIALLAAPAQAATSTSAGHAASTSATASSAACPIGQATERPDCCPSQTGRWLLNCGRKRIQRQPGTLLRAKLP